MTKAQTMWTLVLVLAASGIALAEQPAVWYPAQQAPDSQTAPSTPGAPGQQQPGNQQPGEQPGAPPGASGAQSGMPAGNDPRVDQPMQPVESGQSSSSQAAPAPEVTQMAPDTTPLNSPQNLTLGTPAGTGGRSFLTPGLRASSSVSHTSGVPGLGTEAITDMSGTINAVHSWSHTTLNFDFTEGGDLYSDQTNLNASFSRYGIGLRFRQPRWSFELHDVGSYLPSSAFGFYGTQFLGSGAGGFGTPYMPNQSIYTEGSRLDNTVMGESIFELSGKSSLHFSGSWGILRFQGGGLQNDDNLIFSGGYDHKIGGASTIGLSYIASLTTYGGSAETLDSHTVTLSYARRVTGKLALQVSAGPAIRLLDEPPLGSDSGVSWFLRTGLTYQMGKILWASSFTHYTSAGSGLLGGADTYQWNLGANRSLGRQMQGSANVGISRNSSLFLSGTQETFNYQFVGVQLLRVINREWSLFLSYNLQHQTSDAPACVGCVDSYTRHIVGLGFEWHGRPMMGWF